MKKKGWLIVMIILYLGAGINHFVNADFYLGLMPSWLPVHELLVRLSGVAEILLAILLVFPLTQQLSAWLIMVMLVIFLGGVHVPMVLNFKGWDDPVWWFAIARLPIQYFLFRWAMRYTRGRTVYFWPHSDEKQR